MPVTRALSLHYGSLALFSALLHNVFLLYHVEMFVSVYKIDKTSFWLGEAVFMVWNSCNDPLFGWLSDRGLLAGGKSSPHSVVTRRLVALQWAGPALAVSFLLFWVSWAAPAAQFVVCLCVYDAALTAVDLHHSALLADLAVSSDARTTLNYHAAVCSALASTSVFVSYTVWGRGADQLWPFQVFCVLTAAVALCGFCVCTRRMRRLYAKMEKSDMDVYSDPPVTPSDPAGAATFTCDPGVRPETGTMKRFIKELAGHNNFQWFTAMNLIQVFHCHFNSNFFPLFLDNLLSDSIPQYICSLILGVSFVAPHINNLYFLGLCRKYGVYRVIHWLFVLKLALSVVMATLGPDHMWLVGLYIASNRVFTEGTCKLLALVVSDLVDEDYVLHRRPHAVSALVFGTTALLAKPGQTLAPLLGTWLLARQTGHDVFSGDALRADVSLLSPAARSLYRDGVFSLLVYVPVVCAALQLAAWSRFTLHGSRLRWVKAVRQGALYATV